MATQQFRGISVENHCAKVSLKSKRDEKKTRTVNLISAKLNYRNERSVQDIKEMCFVRNKQNDIFGCT